MMHSEDFNDHTVLQIDLRNLLVTALSTAHVGSTKFQSKRPPHYFVKIRKY